MKVIKYFAIALATLSMAACSTDNNPYDYDGFLGGVNSATGVTVEMNPTFTINENVDVFKVPVKVTGKTNGKVVVTVGVKPGPSSAANETEDAVEGVNYVLTSATVNIPEGSDEGYVECTNIWETGVINDDRVFTMTITDVQGATLGAQKDCVVTIANIDDPYTSMCGVWKLKAKNMSTGAPVEYNITIKTVDPSDPDYGSALYGFGFAGESDYLIPFSEFEFDPVTMTGTMEIGYGWMMTDGIAFNYGLAAPAFPVCMYRSGNSVTTDMQKICTFDGNYNVVNIPQDANIFAGLYYTTTMAFSGYSVGWIGEIELTR